MKNTFLKSSFVLLTASVLAGSCKKFDEINQNPFAATTEQVQVEYFINNSIGGAQQDPHVSERAFVLYWKTAGRQHFTSGLATGAYNDGWSSDYYSYISTWLNHANTAIQVANEKIAAGNIQPYTANLLQVARIWRAYLMSELADNFGPIPINSFQGVNPEFADLKNVYYHLLDELKDASGKLDLTVTNPNDLGKLDPAFGYDYSKWQKYANSMRLRLAMRLSEVDAAKAKTEFEAAAASSNLIRTAAESFQVQERTGWDAYSGVMTREWNPQFISATLNNLYRGLGGVATTEQLPALAQYVKPANYMGIRYENHFATRTNDPSAGYWFDGLPAVIDPRAYKTFSIPGDINNANFSRFPSWTTDAVNTQRNLLNDDGTVFKTINAAYTWNAAVVGDWGAKGAKNQVRNYEGTMPRLSQAYRTSTNKRVFFGPWETYFLLAEGATRGWATPMSGKAAYEAGVTASLAYHGVEQFAAAYLASQSFNRNGTSVSWDHTAEPPATTSMQFVNGYTNAAGTVDMMYSKNDLYKNGTVKNDHLTKIITQKFIAQTPWLPLETWNDHRRLGLPFFENPAVENPIPTMPALTASNYTTSNIKFFPQRLKYPSSLPNSNPSGYQQAVGFLGGADDVFTPLWWAKKQ